MSGDEHRNALGSVSIVHMKCLSLPGSQDATAHAIQGGNYDTTYDHHLIASYLIFSSDSFGERR